MLRELNVVEQRYQGKTVEVTVEADTYQITAEDGITVTAPRKTSRDIKRHKASSYDIWRPEPMMDVCDK